MTLMVWRKSKNGITFRDTSFIYPLSKSNAHNYLLGMTGSFDMDSIRKICFNLDDNNNLSIIIRYSDGLNEQHDIGEKEQYKLYRIMIKNTGLE